MSYQKQYTQQSVRAIHKEVNGHGYVYLHFDYAYIESTYDRESGSYVPRYRPLKRSTGIALEKKHWGTDGPNEQCRKEHGNRRYANLLATIEAARKEVFDAYESLMDELGTKPSPEQIREKLDQKGQKNKAQIPLASYIEALADGKHFADTKTRQKYRTLATYIRAVEACRKGHPVFRRMAEGSGTILLSTFSLKDWGDLELLMQVVSTDIPRRFAKGGVNEIGFDLDPFYSEATLHKTQSNLLAVLRKAVKDPNLKLNLNVEVFEKIAIRRSRKVHLTPEEIQAVLDHRFDQPYLENARRIMCVQMLTGVRVSDLRKVLESPILQIHGRRTKFLVQYFSTKKTGEPICLPLFQPVLDILQSPDKPHMVAGSNLNLYYKEVAKAIGLSRIIHRVERKANKKKIDRQEELHSILTTHACRATYFSLLTGYLFVSRLLATKATGHRLSEAQGEDEGYFQLSPEHMAESLLAQSLLSHENIPFEILPNGFAEAWEAGKRTVQRTRLANVSFDGELK